MKKGLALLLALLLMALPAMAEEPDEQDIALVDEEEILTEDPEVFTQSDVGDEKWERPIDEGYRPEFVSQLLEIARAELGYTEGRNNYSKYGQWSGDPNAAWCAEFICWCVDQLDQQSGTELLKVVYPKYSGQNTGRDWFIKRGRFVYRKGLCPDWGSQWERGSNHNLEKNEFIPRSGDLMFFSYNEAGDTAHVALVEYCAYDSEGNVIVHVIEGNNPSSVQRNSYYLANSQVLGFGLCDDAVDTTMRIGNRGDKVLRLQQWLNRLGILAQRHLTGGFGGNTRAAVQQFQSQYMKDKSATGIADRETQQAIEREIERVTFEDPSTWMVVE